MVSSTPRPHFTPRKDPVPIVQEAGWAPRPVWTGRISHPHRDSIQDRPASTQSLYRLSYRAHKLFQYPLLFTKYLIFFFVILYSDQQMHTTISQIITLLHVSTLPYIIFRQLLINTLPTYTSMSNAVLGNIIYSYLT